MFPDRMPLPERDTTIPWFDTTEPDISNNVISFERYLEEKRWWEYAAWATSTFEPQRDQITMLKRLYAFRDEDQVADFLQLHVFLIPLLEEISEKVQEYFPDSPMDLHVLYADEEESPLLVASVRPSVSAREAFSTMKRFRHEWWFDEMDRAEDQLLVTVAF